MSHDEGSGDGHGRPQPISMATRIDNLFKMTADANGRQHSYRSVAEAIRSETGEPVVSASYLQQLRTGQKENPTLGVVEALAKYFGVPPNYFFDEQLTAEVDAELKMLRTLRDNGVMNVALRAQGLSPESLETLGQLIDRTRRLEGLDDHTKSGQTRRFKPRKRTSDHLKGESDPGA